MQITNSSTTETARGPKDWFTGTVLIDTVAVASSPSRTGAALVHFTPGERHGIRTRWVRPST